MHLYIWTLLPASAAFLLILWAKRRQMWAIMFRRKKAPPWARGITAENAWDSWGSVYVLRCVCDEHQDIRKVGFTGRRVKTRSLEIARTMTGDKPTRQCFAIDRMPFAWAVEAQAHYLLRKKRKHFPAGDPMGTEWFHCRSDDELEEIIDAVIQAAFDVRQIALNHFCWPVNANPVMVRMTDGIDKQPLFTEENSPGLKLAC